MKKTITLIATLMMCLAIDAQIIDLSGKWKFAMGDKPEYNDNITLPGSMLTNNKGNEVSVNTQWVSSLYDSSFYFNPYMEKYRVTGNMKFPFFLTPSKHYVGTAWYEKTVNVPKEWKKNRILLYLERPHIETTVFVNGKETGRDSSLSVAHEFDVTPYIIYGKPNTIAIKIYNGIENVCVGQDSHSVTDQTQGNWNGIIGRMQLQAVPKCYINSLQVYPDARNKQIHVDLKVADDGKTHKVVLEHRLLSGGSKTTTAISFKGGSHSVTIPMGDNVQLWDEFTPNLYELAATMNGHTVTTTFGMRDFTIEGRQFYINNRKTWIRGTVGNCCFPLTGYPPTDETSWIRIFTKCKEYGLNMMRFHSYCPPEAAFAAADKVGFYLQPEGPSWPNHGVKLGVGMSIDHYLLNETKRMVEKYGNHPSFCMLAAGNEPTGNWVKWVGDFTDYWHATGDNRRVYCGASVGGGWAFDPKSDYHVKGGARGLTWDKSAPQSTDNFDTQVVSFLQKGRKPVTFDINEPYLSHEQGQWCAFPDLKETSQYTGAYKAGNFEIFTDMLKDNGMASQADKFLMASGKLQTLAYKYEMERNLRTKDYAGFQLLGLNDYSGQGTALVGVLNVFWKEKGYCTANDWSEFCSPIVPLAKFPKFTYTNAETLSVDVELYNAYKETLTNATTHYTICDNNGNTLTNGTLKGGDIDVGKNIELGNVQLPLNSIESPSRLTLTVSIKADNTSETAKNRWDFWVYPDKLQMPSTEGIYITDTLDTKAISTLKAGGKVLITAAGKVRYGSDVKQTYLPVFWNTSWFKMRPPHTTGAYIDTTHPLFKRFPTENWGNINWWELLNRAQVMNLSKLPHSYQPAIQPIDTWHVSRKLGMMIEANVLDGKLLMTTMDITSNLDSRIVARQMRKAIIEYMQSDDFAPTLQLDAQTITDFFEKEAPAVNMFTKDSPDELKPKLK